MTAAIVAVERLAHAAQQRVAREVSQRLEQRIRDRELAGLDVHAELGRALTRINLLLDACDEALADPDNPGRYTLDAHARELRVIFGEWVDGPKGQPVQVARRARLQELLDRCAEHDLDVYRIDVRVADPRTLVLRTAMALQRGGQMLLPIVKELAERAQGAAVLQSPEWQNVRGVLVEALREHPAARAAVIEALARVGAATSGDAG